MAVAAREMPLLRIPDLPDVPSGGITDRLVLRSLLSGLWVHANNRKVAHAHVFDHRFDHYRSPRAVASRSGELAGIRGGLVFVCGLSPGRRHLFFSVFDFVAPRPTDP